jgi:TonB family protein
MGDFLPRSLSGNGKDNVIPFLSAAPPETAHSTESADLVAILREILDEGLQPPAAILHSAAEAARILADADGAALALRTHGVIVCRARSGDPTPELGASLNTDSGISGACLRAASILVCHDTESDTRVDPDVCRAMGIRSIAAVPLRGPAGIAGILEVFSTRPKTFRDSQIDSLRALAEIVETAYGRELRGLQAKPAPAVKAPRIGMGADEMPAAIATPAKPAPGGTSLARQFWIIAAVVVAMLLVVGVWFGHEPGLETSAKESWATAHSSEIHSPVAESTTPAAAIAQPKPEAGVTNSDRSAAETVTNASTIETVEDSSVPLKAVPEDVSAAETEPIPDPSLAAPVSQGITRGKLIHKVEPVYPSRAKTQGVFGTVQLEVTIGEDGSVRDVTPIHGNSILAEAASEAIRQWRYTPFLLNGKPQTVQKQIKVLFKLPNQMSR